MSINVLKLSNDWRILRPISKMDDPNFFSISCAKIATLQAYLGAYVPSKIKGPNSQDVGLYICFWRQQFVI